MPGTRIFLRHGLLAILLVCTGLGAAQAQWRVVDRPFGAEGGRMAVSPRGDRGSVQVRYYCMPSSAGSVERIAVHDPGIGPLETNRAYTVHFAFPDTGDQLLPVPMLARPIARSIESDGLIDYLIDVMQMQDAMAVTRGSTVSGYPISLAGFAEAMQRVRASCNIRS